MNRANDPSFDRDSTSLVACIECGVIASESYHFLTKVDLCKGCFDEMIHEFASHGTESTPDVMGEES